MVDSLIIYIGLFVGGVIIGMALSFRKNYRNKILEILDYLKFAKKIDNDEYEYYKVKFIDKQDDIQTLKKLSGLIKRRKKEHEQPNGNIE